MDTRETRIEADPDFLPYTRWEAFSDHELDILSHCIRLPQADDEWHEAWLMLGQINVEVERRRQ